MIPLWAGPLWTPLGPCNASRFSGEPETLRLHITQTKDCTKHRLQTAHDTNSKLHE